MWKLIVLDMKRKDLGKEYFFKTKEEIFTFVDSNNIEKYQVSFKE